MPYTTELSYEFDCDGSLSVEEQNNTKVIFPNPSNGQVNITTGWSDYSISVYDVMGRVVFENNQFNDGMINLKENGKGVYFIKISDGNQEKVEKVLIF